MNKEIKKYLINNLDIRRSTKTNKIDRELIVLCKIPFNTMKWYKQENKIVNLIKFYG